jgi:hypothetical protein
LGSKPTKYDILKQSSYKNKNYHSAYIGIAFSSGVSDFFFYWVLGLMGKWLMGIGLLGIGLPYWRVLPYGVKGMGGVSQPDI